MNIEKRVIKAISEVIAVERDQIKPESSLSGELNCDSLDMLEIAMALEEEFECNIDDEAALKLTTVQQVIDHMQVVAYGAAANDSTTNEGNEMKSSIEEIKTIIGTAMGEGFYAGRIRIDEQAYALIVAPKAEGRREAVEWNSSSKTVEGATSYFDGLSNTEAMAAAGSELAQWARGLRIGGCDDWYIPAQDELEIIYRNLKPTTEQNALYARSGINLSAIEPTRPYAADFPVQTMAEAFKEGGSEAFEPEWFWSSTQHAAYSYYSWYQYFGNGCQYYYDKSYELRAVAVRRLPI